MTEHDGVTATDSYGTSQWVSAELMDDAEARDAMFTGQITDAARLLGRAVVPGSLKLQALEPGELAGDDDLAMHEAGARHVVATMDLQ